MVLRVHYLKIMELIIIDWPDTVLRGESHKSYTVANTVETEKYTHPQYPAHELAHKAGVQ